MWRGGEHRPNVEALAAIPRRGNPTVRFAWAEPVRFFRLTGADYFMAALVAFGVYLLLLPTLRFGLTNWDDGINVTDNPLLRLPLSTALGRVWGAPYENLYIPLTYTSYLLDKAVGGLSAPVFHFSNNLLHALNAGLVLLLLRLWLRPAASALGVEAMPARAGEGHPISRAVELAYIYLPCVAGAVVFALHPLQAEPVAWVTGRKDLLAGGLGLGAAVLFARKGWASWGALAAFAAALLAKPTVLGLPLVLVAAAWLAPARVQLRAAGAGARRRWIGAGWVLLGAAAIAITAWAQPVPETIARFSPWWKRALVASDALAWYGFKTLWPTGLGPIAPKPIEAAGLGWRPVLMAALGAAALVALVFHGPGKRRRGGLLVLAIVWWLAALLPVSGLRPFLYQDYAIVADRYAYFALVGVALAVGWGVRWLIEGGALRASQAGGALPSEPQPLGVGRLVAAGAVVAGLAVALGVPFSAQLQHWKSSKALWARGVEVAPRSAEARLYLGRTLMDAGQLAEAQGQVEEALRLDAKYGEALSTLGAIQLKMLPATGAADSLGSSGADARRDRLETARRCLARAIELHAAAGVRDRRAVVAHANLAVALLRLGDAAGAERELRAAVGLGGAENPTLLANLGAVLGTQGKHTQAAEVLRAAMAVAPRNAEISAAYELAVRQSALQTAPAGAAPAGVPAAGSAPVRAE